VDEEQTKKNFLTAEADIHYLSEVVYDWLIQNNRMTSRKYLIGESYGGYRVPRLATYLQTEIGVGSPGITMGHPLSIRLPWRKGRAVAPALGNHLPLHGRGLLRRQGKPLDDASMAAVELYSRTEFVTDFLAGRSDNGDGRLATKCCPDRARSRTRRKLDGRVDVMTYLRESRQARAGSGRSTTRT